MFHAGEGWSSRAVPLAIMALAVVTAFALALPAWSSGGHSIIRLLHWWLVTVDGDDSWKPMRAAYLWFKQGDGTPIYQHVFFQEHIKFQYPPSSLLIFALGERLGFSTSNHALNAIGWFGIPIVALATGAHAWLFTRDWPELILRLAATGIATVAALTFYPVLWSYTQGQIQLWFSAMFALASLCWLFDRKAAAGALIGAICFAKPQFLLFLVWALWRRDWHFARAMAVVLVLIFGASLAVFGWANHVDYLNALSYMSHHGEAFIRNYTVNGVMNRLVGNGQDLEFEPNAYAPYHPLVYWTTVLSSCALIGLALFRRRGGVPTLFDFFIVALSLTLASPIAWEHHFGIMPVMFVVLALTLAKEKARWLSAAVLFLAFISCDVFLPPIASLAYGPESLLQSPMFFGVVGVLILLYRGSAVLPPASKPHEYALAIKGVAEQPAQQGVGQRT